MCRTSHHFTSQACLDVQHPVLLTGTTGVGKSLVAASALDGLRERKGALPFSISFSAQTSAADTQVRHAQQPLASASYHI